MNYDGTVIIGTELDTSGFEDGINDIEKKDINGKFDKLKGIVGVIGNKLKSVIASVLGISRAVVGLIAKLGLIGTIVGALILVGKLISEAFTIATEENKELQAQIQYIKFAIRSIAIYLAQGIGKILKWIIEKVYDLLGFIGGIIKAITKKNIFSNASIKDFSNSLKSANKNTKGISKNLKEIQKSLAGFDEINKLSGGSAGVGLLGGALGGEDDISKYIAEGDDLATKTEGWAKKIKEAFKVPTVDELWGTWKTIWGTGWYWFDKIFKISETIKKIKEEMKPIDKWIKENVFKPILSDFKETFLPTYNWLKDNIFTPIKDELVAQKKQALGGWKETKDGILKEFAPFVNKIIYYINTMLAPFGIQLNYIKDEAEETGETITTAIGGATDDIRSKIQELSTTKYEIKMTSKDITNIGDEVKKVADNLSTLTKKNWKVNASLSLKAATQQVKDVLSKVAGVTLPKLAKGGIVNMPGRGVPVGGAYAGERGMEGVIPLTDSQQMALLGEAIGRYITINANIPVSMNGRVISRELKKVTSENDFATNGGM